MFDAHFLHIPADAVVPGILEAGDISDVVAALDPRPTLLESLVDGRNRRVRGEDGTINVGRWLLAHLADSR